MKWLLFLYPRAWRRRYGDEYLALLEQTGLGWRTLVDCLRGALDAHVHAAEIQIPAESPATPIVEAAPVSPIVAEPTTQEVSRRPFASLRADGFETVIDQILSEAAARGVFDNLAGTGKPIPVDENPFAGEWASAYRILRQSGETLPWIALGQEIDADEARLRSALGRMAEHLRHVRAESPEAYAAARDDARRRYLEQAAALDRKLGEHSRAVPHPRFERGRLTPTTAAARFDAACPPPAP
jgi:hypothetical protein